MPPAAPQGAGDVARTADWQPPPGGHARADAHVEPGWEPQPGSQPPEGAPRDVRLPLRELLSQGVQLDGAGFRVGVTAAALALVPVALIAPGLPDLPGSLLQFGGYFFTNAVLVQLLAACYVRGRPQIWPAYGTAARKVPALFGAAIVQGVAVVLVIAPLFVVLPSGPELPLLVAAPLLLFLLGRWSLYAQVIVLENQGPLAGLRRSWSLVRGSTLRVLAVFAVFSLFSIVSSVAVLSLLEEFVMGSLDPFVAMLLDTSVDVVVAPVVPAGLTVAYFDLLGRADRSRFRRPARPAPAVPSGGPSPLLTR